jgi:hypothetical protein
MPSTPGRIFCDKHRLAKKISKSKRTNEQKIKYAKKQVEWTRKNISAVKDYQKKYRLWKRGLGTKPKKLELASQKKERKQYERR